MRCPNCDGKIKDGKYVCEICGTKVADIENASYEKAVEILNKGNLYEKEKIFYSHKIPKEISRKKLLLFTIFLGLFGAHDLYVGKKKLGIAKMVCFIVAEIIGILTIENILVGFGTISGLILLFPFATWIFDVFKVIFKKYPFPYVMEK